MAYEISEMKKVGIGLLGCGILFTFLGIVLFFDRGLLALGNIFWLCGIALLLGWQSTWNLFTKKINYKVLAWIKSSLFILIVDYAMKHWYRKLTPLTAEWSLHAFSELMGSVSFFLGLFLIFVRWPILGIILEIYGSAVLFSGFWPSAKVFLYQIPVIGWLLQYCFS